MNHLVCNLAGSFDAVGVQFDAVSDDLLISSNLSESAAISDTGIHCGTSRDRKLQEGSNPFRLCQGKRKIAKLFLARQAHELPPYQAMMMLLFVLAFTA